MTLKIDFTAACCVHGFRISDMCYVDITSAGVVSLCSLPSFLSPAPSLVQLTELGRCSTPAPVIVIVRHYLALPSTVATLLAPAVMLYSAATIQ